MKRIYILFLTFVFFIPSFAINHIYHKGWIDFNKNGIKDIYEDGGQPIDKRVKDLLSQMTIEEKTCQLATLYGFGRVLKDSLPTVGWKNEIWKDGIANIDEQLNGVGSGYKRAHNMIVSYRNHVKAKNEVQRWFVEETRLGIPVEFTNEGIHGLNHTGATALPAPIGIGSTWNKELVRKAGRIVGKEAKALGYNNVYAPILDVARDQRWGRLYECYGEDPYLVSELGGEMVEGIQENGIASTLKHFAVYSVPKGGRDGKCRTDPHVNPRELHEIYLYPFKKVISEHKPMGIMSSYNDWDGIPISASHYFLTELLREEYGFDGYVVSDSEAVEFLHTKHQVAETYDEAVRQVLEAGLNVRTHFTPPSDFIMAVRRLISSSKISMDIIDKRVSEVLSVKFRLGLFDNPFQGDIKNSDNLVGSDKNIDFIKEIQSQALVLLKNRNNILPLDKNKLSRILITGPMADEDNMLISRYGPNGLPCVTVLDGLKKYLDGSNVKLIYEKGCDVTNQGWPQTEIIGSPLSKKELNMMNKAVNAAEHSDIVIAVLGEDDNCVGESRSRTSLDFPGRQQLFLERLYATGKPIILVMMNGQPLTVNWANQYIDGILEAWFPSYIGGEVIAETIFGDNNPSGKLTVTFPKTIGQIEYNFPFKKGAHGTQYASGPNGSGNTRVQGALFPFGYGLSYTTYEYMNLKIHPKLQNSQGSYEISCDIKNTGKVKGTEIIQLYVKDKFSSVVTYNSVLRGFERVTLSPGETKTVHFTIKPSDLQILDRNMNWTVEAGDFEIMIGASSDDIKLKGNITVVD